MAYKRKDNQRITFDVPILLGKKLKDKAKKDGRSLSETIRRMLIAFLDAWG